MLFKISEVVDNNITNMNSHSSHTAGLAKIISRQLGFSCEESLLFYFAGIFHDIGKIIIPNSILNKPTSLNTNEWAIIQNHAAFGASFFEPLEEMHPLMPIIRGHHEWMDGSGYPDHLVGEQIPLGARILSVADAYSTIIDGRAYRNKRTPAQAQDELVRCKHSQFDPKIVDALLTVLA
jgi:putative nucleotidyltransferase with HDIG domain